MGAVRVNRNQKVNIGQTDLNEWKMKVKLSSAAYYETGTKCLKWWKTALGAKISFLMQLSCSWKTLMHKMCPVYVIEVQTVLNNLTSYEIQMGPR